MFEPRISIITLGVADMTRSIAFYRDGLGIPTDITGDTADWAIFQTVGTRFALYPKDLLAADIAADYPKTGIGFGGITLAHNVSNESEVAKLLTFAESAGGEILKPAQPAEWGGHNGYFARRLPVGNRLQPQHPLRRRRHPLGRLTGADAGIIPCALGVSVVNQNA